MDTKTIEEKRKIREIRKKQYDSMIHENMTNEDYQDLGRLMMKNKIDDTVDTVKNTGKKIIGVGKWIGKKLTK